MGRIPELIIWPQFCSESSSTLMALSRLLWQLTASRMVRKMVRLRIPLLENGDVRLCFGREGQCKRKRSVAMGGSRMNRRCHGRALCRTGPSSPDAAHFREAHFGGLHASRHHAQDSVEYLRAQRRIALAAGSQDSPFHLQGGGVFARPHLEQGVLIVEQGTPSEDVPR